MVSTRLMRAPRTSPRKRTLKVNASSPTRLFKPQARRANLRLPPSPCKGAKHGCAKAMHACDMWARRKRFDLDAMREVAAASRPKTEYEIAWMQRLQAIIQLMEQREAAADQDMPAALDAEDQAGEDGVSGEVQAAMAQEPQASEQAISDIQVAMAQEPPALAEEPQASEQAISDIQAAMAQEPPALAQELPDSTQEPPAPNQEPPALDQVTGNMQVVTSASASQAPPPSALPVAPMAAHGGSSPKRQIPLKDGSRILANRYGLRIKEVDNGRISFNRTYAYRGTVKADSGHFKEVYFIEQAVVLAPTPVAYWVQSAYASGCGCSGRVKQGPDAKHAKGCCFADPVRAKAMAAYEQAGAPRGPLVQPEGPTPKGCIFLTADEASQFMTLQHSTVSFTYVISSGEVKYYGNKTQRLYDTRLRAAAMEARHVDDSSA